MKTMTEENQSNEHLDNVAFIKHMMEFSHYGAMKQVFIIEAIRFYAETILKTPVPDDKPDEMFNPKVWHAVAFEVNNEIANRFKSQAAISEDQAADSESQMSDSI